MENNSEQSRFTWRFGENMTNLQDRVRDNTIQHHVGQVVRGVLPGAGREPQYHPNPYLQHLYENVEAHRANIPPQQGDRDIELGDLEAQLQEVLTQADDLEGGEMTGTHGHTHGHTHTPRPRPSLDDLDWKVILSSVSFVIILFLRLMADHILGLVVFLGLSIIFYYSNTRMIEIVHITSLREGQNKVKVVVSCLTLTIFLLSNIGFIYWIFQDQQLWRVLYFHLPTSWQGDVFDLFWVTMVTDHIIRFGTIIVKAVISITPHLCCLQKKKGKYYMFTETVIQLYRSCLPIIPWVHFLYDQPKSGKLVFAAILTVIYIVLKFWTLFTEFLKLKKAFQLLKTDTQFGVQPSMDDVNSCGENSCPICQDDFQDPIMLSCKHIFCESCVSIWFDREKTCPMCRAQIKAESPVWQDGSTSAHLQWY